MFALPIFTARAIYRHVVRNCPGDSCRHLQFRFDIVKAPHFRVELSVFALPIFTASHPATIVGVHVLNFCVRDGNRWTHMTINTNSLRWLLTIPFISKPEGSNILVTHTGFEPMLTA